VQLWVKFLNSPNWETVLNEGTQGEVPYTLLPTNLLISLLPAHNSMFIGLFGKVLKCKNEINKKKEENKGQEN